MLGLCAGWQMRFLSQISSESRILGERKYAYKIKEVSERLKESDPDPEVRSMAEYLLLYKINPRTEIQEPNK